MRSGGPAALLAALLLAAPAWPAFYAASGRVDITPDLSKHRVLLAGHGATGRKVEAVRDPLYARALVVSDGTTTAAFVTVDLLGLFRNEWEAIRDELGWKDGGPLLFLTASHTHSGPDTVGLWGPRLGFSGVDPHYQAWLRSTLAGLVRETAGRLKEARLAVASTQLDPAGLCQDGRDPTVIDPDLVVAKLRGGDGEPIATVVRWSCHAEAAGRVNRKLTADWPGAMCRELERGGGACLFLPGAIGGLMKPVPTAPVDDVEGRYKDVERIGMAVADAVERLMTRRPYRVPSRFEAAVATVRIPVENSRYILFLPSLAFGHRLYDASGVELTWWRMHLFRARQVLLPIRKRFPRVDTQVGRVVLGDLEMLLFPGEVFPELILGGYDGEYRFGWPLTRPNNPNPPDLTQAPRPPYLKARMKGFHKMVVGLTNDMLGYMVPHYDFKVNPSMTLLPEPAGHHYEETNSVGRDATSVLLGAARDLIGR